MSNKNDNLVELTKWANEYDIDLTKATIYAGTQYTWEEYRCGLKVNFNQSDETRTNFQHLKFGLGGRFPNEPNGEGVVDKAPEKLTALLHLTSRTVLDKDTCDVLKDKVDYKFTDCVLITWNGAYTCKATEYNCEQADFKEED
jgi:hypothetical protein